MAVIQLYIAGMHLHTNDKLLISLLVVNQMYVVETWLICSAIQ